jgi:hypothetical protein
MQPDPELPPPKVFKPKHSLPPVIDYKVDPGSEFWAKFPANNTRVGKSTIYPHKLRNLAWSVHFRDKELLEQVCRDLEDGADIGCKGAARTNGQQ